MGKLGRWMDEGNGYRAQRSKEGPGDMSGARYPLPSTRHRPSSERPLRVDPDPSNFARVRPPRTINLTIT